jgi:hypothetical protein
MCRVTDKYEVTSLMVLGPVLLSETVEEVLADMWVTLDAEAVETLSAMVHLVYDFEDTQPNPMAGPMGKMFIDVLSKHQQCDSLILDPLQEDVGNMIDIVTELAQLLPRFGASLYVAMVEGRGCRRGEFCVRGVSLSVRSVNTMCLCRSSVLRGRSTNIALVAESPLRAGISSKVDEVVVKMGGLGFCVVVHIEKEVAYKTG